MKRRALLPLLCLVGIPLIGCGDMHVAQLADQAEPDALAQEDAARDWRDQLFFKQITANDLDEIQLGELALGRSKNAAVQDFARAMIADHTAMRKRAQALVSGGLTLAESMDVFGKAQHAFLTKAADDKFDHLYVDGQVQMHHVNLKVLEQAVKHAVDPDLKALAATAMPEASLHLARAKLLSETLPR